MRCQLEQSLNGLSADQAFRLLYAAYAHLAARADDVPSPDAPSSTQRLLRRLGRDDTAATLLCVRKMLEERDEVWEVLAGGPRADGLSPRQALVAELTQMLYWPTLLAVGRASQLDASALVSYIDRGRAGDRPAKAEIDRDGDAAAILHRVLLDAGRALAAFAGAYPDEPPIEPRELALADLGQMAARPYLEDYLRANLGMPQDLP